MTVAPVGNLMAIFEAQIAKNDEDMSRAGACLDDIENSYYVKTASAVSLEKYTRPVADSIRDKVRLFDEGQLTFVQRLTRALDFRPDEAEFIPSESKSVFERRSSMGPGVVTVHKKRPSRCLSPVSVFPTTTVSAAFSSDDDKSRAASAFANLPASPKILKSKIRRASTGVNLLETGNNSQQEEERGKEKSPKRKKKRRKGKATTDQAVLEHSNRESCSASLHSKPTSPPSKSKSPSKTKSPRKSNGKKSKTPSSRLPQAPSLDESSHKRRRGRRKDKKKSRKKSSEHQKADPCPWDLILQQHDQQRRALLGSLHRSVSMELPKTRPLTRARALARRASTGRLRDELWYEDPNYRDLWEVNATHAVQVSKENSDPNAQIPLSQQKGDLVEMKAESGARQAPSRRMIRRHSTGSLSARSSGGDDTPLVDFWHTYEEETDSDSSVDACNGSLSPQKRCLRFARKRTVRFEKNVTVWVFTKEDAPPACDLELPQAFNASTPAADSAPRAPIRRNHSIDLEQRPPRVDGAPSPPKRNRSVEFGPELFSEEGATNVLEDDANSVDSWPVPSRQTRQTQLRKVKRGCRVRFAEELEEVRYFEKDSIPEVVLPQIGIIFCATAEVEEDQAPQAPRRSNSNTGDLMCSIQETISTLRQNENLVRERREIDLKPRQPARMDSVRSLSSQNSDESTISLYDGDDKSLGEFSDEEDDQEKPRLVSPLRPGQVRGDSILRIDTDTPSTSRKESSTRPVSMRSDSAGSLGSADGSVGGKERTQLCIPRSLRPERFRGNSVKGLKDNGSSTSMPSSYPSSKRMAQSLRPSKFRGDSFVKLSAAGAAAAEEGAQDIIWEGAGDVQDIIWEGSEHSMEPLDLSPHLISSILEMDAEGNSVSDLDDRMMQALSKRVHKKTTITAESAPVPVKKSRKLPFFGRRRRSVSTSQSKNEDTNRPNVFTKVSVKRSKLLRRASTEV